MHCQEKNEISRKIFAFWPAGAVPFLREEHIARLFAPAPAMRAVKNHVIGENVVLCFEAQRLRRLVDRTRWPFQFQKNPDGGLVQFNHQPLGPSPRSWQPERRAKLLILKAPAHSQSLEDPRERLSWKPPVQSLRAVCAAPSYCCFPPRTPGA